LIFALSANGACFTFALSAKSKEETHLKASMIFTSNGLLISLGAPTTSVLECGLSSIRTNLTIGAVVFILVV
jgi:hypothetical protein